MSEISDKLAIILSSTPKFRRVIIDAPPPIPPMIKQICKKSVRTKVHRRATSSQMG